eukprot:CAMPEP_0171087298 /NCGR_PEP_ID=MMETSP0766_2-20121228/20063_1 /TAXON_ID=439317 /ORGANISM="Gambierdiscus australes, Strain CAWD 149" /LENGTH=61 /DNA_ID=CAMNT_0011544991 /DNA_START=250 /DNA_END=431 /DNA_ORIENTATION=+
MSNWPRLHRPVERAACEEHNEEDVPEDVQLCELFVEVVHDDVAILQAPDASRVGHAFRLAP